MLITAAARDVTADADILCDIVVVIRATIKERSSTYHARFMCSVVCFFDSKGRHPKAEVYSIITLVYSSHEFVTNKQCKFEVLLCNHCSSGKAISITYFECIFVALDIQHVMRTCRVIYHL